MTAFAMIVGASMVVCIFIFTVTILRLFPLVKPGDEAFYDEMNKAEQIKESKARLARMQKHIEREQLKLEELTKKKS